MGNAEAIVFYLVSFVTIIGAFFAIFSVRYIKAAISIFLSFLSLGILFFSLELPILGIIQIISSIACLLILLLITFISTEKKSQFENGQNSFLKIFISLLVVLSIVFCISIFIKFGMFFNEGIVMNYVMPSTKDFSIEMFTNYSIPFLFTGVFFLAGILGLGIFMFDVRNGKGGRK